MTTEITTNADALMPELISPEGLVIAQKYIEHGGDSQKAAVALDMPIEVVQQQIKKHEVKAYIDQIFYETGFRSRERLFGVLDQVINLKLEEMEESGLGSSEDILTILTKAHSMKMAEGKQEIEKIKAMQAAGGPTNQTNVQINNNMPGSNDPGYMDVLNLLTNPSGGK